MKNLILTLLFAVLSVTHAQSAYSKPPEFQMLCVDPQGFNVAKSIQGNPELKPGYNYCGFVVYAPLNAPESSRVDFIANLRYWRPCGSFGNPRYCLAEKRIDQKLAVNNGYARGIFDTYAFQPSFLQKTLDAIANLSPSTKQQGLEAAASAIFGFGTPYVALAQVGFELLNVFRSQSILYRIETWARVCSPYECTPFSYQQIDVVVPSAFRQ
jgi:hypothetical protein